MTKRRIGRVQNVDTSSSTTNTCYRTRAGNREASAAPNTSRKCGRNETSIRKSKRQWVPVQEMDSQADTPLTQADIPRIVEAVLTNLPQQQDTPSNAKPPDPERDSPPDHTNVNLLPRNLEGIPLLPADNLLVPENNLVVPANNSVAPLPGESRGMLPGAAIPPVPSKVVERIESGLFIEMGDLVPTRLGLEESARSKLKQHTCTNICEWLQAFAVYVSVLGKKQPHRIPDLMGYQVLILEASNEYKNECWLAYDRHFRQQAAADPQCKWSNINPTLWNLAFTSQARASHCKHCFSLFHSSRDCELAPDVAIAWPKPQYSKPLYATQGCQRLICCRWNEEPTQNCSYPNCCYEHVCQICVFDLKVDNISHKAMFCPNRPTHNLKPAMNRRPTPLFP